MITFHYETLDSTSDQANRLMSRHSGQALLVSADVQTGGRGRNGRAWRSPLGGAWFSIVWPMTHPVDRYACSTIAVGWSVLRAIRCVMDTNHRLEIKWPNDVLLDGKKVAGVLCEQMLSMESASPTDVIIGIGINANIEHNQLVDGFRYPATSIQAEIGKTVELQSLIALCVEGIQEAMLSLEQDGLTSKQLRLIEQQLAWIGELVSLHIGEREVVGTCVGLDAHGRLRLEVDGQEQVFNAGEISRLSLKNINSSG